MNLHSGFRRSFFVVGFVILLIILTLFSTAHDTLASSNPDYDNALATAPKGLNWNNDAFSVADFSAAYAKRKADGTNLGNSSNYNVQQNASKVNNAKIIKSRNPNNPDTSIIQLTNNRYQTGAVWSNMKNDNYFDISHEQKASMWLYLGSSSSDLPGDGMAFVLQNDPNGENSIALSADGYPVNGQSLGVWGADWNINNYDVKNLTQTAIQNSWALEFDTFVNYNGSISSKEGVSFDYYLPGVYNAARHIAGGYPASTNTYYPNDSYPYTFYMRHDKPAIHSDLVSNSWRHVTITWEPINNSTKGNLSYSYNDKDPVTGEPTGNNRVTTFTLDTQKFGLTGDNKKLYWGFTGSTGNNSENNLMIFESLPSFVDAEASVNVYNDSKNSEPVTSSVDSNDDVTYKYTLNYKGWTKTWDKINAIMKIPDHITFSSGTITYPNSPTDKNPRPIPTDVFTASTNNKLNYLLPEKLSSESRTAIITLKGKAEKTSSTELKVPAVHTSFEGDNLITGVETPAFTIMPRALSIDSDSPNPIKLNPIEDAHVPGQVSYIGSGNTPDYSSMIVHQIFNGTDTDLGNIVDSTGHFELSFSSKELAKINSLTFYVTDSAGDKSNSISRQIEVGGLLKFGNVQQNVNFKPINGSYLDQIVPRANNWQIDVVDSRDIGSDWTVQANATSLSNGKSTLNGNLFYRDNNGKDQDLTIPVSVATHKKDILGTQTKNIADTWTPNSGILLDMKKGNQAGQYEGTIFWSLIDSVH